MEKNFSVKEIKKELLIWSCGVHVTEEAHKSKQFVPLLTHLAFQSDSITKTCLYNFNPLKPHFYIVKTGVYNGIHYFSHNAKKKDCGHSLEPPRRF